MLELVVLITSHLLHELDLGPIGDGQGFKQTNLEGSQFLGGHLGHREKKTTLATHLALGLENFQLKITCLTSAKKITRFLSVQSPTLAEFESLTRGLDQEAKKSCGEDPRNLSALINLRNLSSGHVAKDRPIEIDSPTILGSSIDPLDLGQVTPENSQVIEFLHSRLPQVSFYHVNIVRTWAESKSYSRIKSTTFSTLNRSVLSREDSENCSLLQREQDLLTREERLPWGSSAEDIELETALNGQQKDTVRMIPLPLTQCGIYTLRS